jgi:hypothetical protein
VQGQGQTFSGAGGLEIAFVSISTAVVWKGPAVLVVHVAGKQVFRKTLEPWKETPAGDEIEKKKETPPSRVATWLQTWGKRMASKVDHTALPSLARRLVGRLWSASLDGHLTCGFRNPAITGKLAAVMAVSQALLSPLGSIETELDWSGTNRVNGAFHLSFRVVPLLLGWDLLWFLVRHVQWTQRSGS